MGLREEITELEQRFAQAPDSRLFLPLADALRRAGEVERAEKLCRDGLERYPDFTSARILLGECLAERGDYQQAGEVLEKAAESDSGNRRLKAELDEITRKLGGESGQGPEDDGKAAVDEVEAEAEKQPEDSPGEEAVQESRQETPAQAGETDTATTEAGSVGESFITHTLGDIYRMQGHDRKAFEVYKQLVEQGKHNPELRDKIEELASRLGEEPVTAQDAQQQAGEEAVTDTAPRVQDGERFEERIDSIFHFLLGDSPEHGDSGEQGVGAPSGSSSRDPGSDGFVDLLEDWIDDLKQGA